MAESKIDKEAASSPPAEDPFLCPICLDPFTDPVTTPCGHNFCKNCITGQWNMTERCVCPVCREAFNTKPELRVNTLLSEMTARFRQTTPATSSSSSNNSDSGSSSNPEKPAAKPQEVLCDICPEPKLKAIKSCQVCLVSYCETHLNPHMTVAVLKRHQLMEPVENMEGRMCLKHDKLLELFCRTDQTCVCMLCMVLDHKNHNVVPLKDESEEKKAELVKTEAGVQQMIQERQQKIQEMKQSVKLSQTNADKAIAEGRHVCTDVKDSVDRSLDELTKTIKEKQKTTEKQAEEFIKELEKEISELKKKSSVMKQLSQSEDHHHILQSVLSPSTICQLPSTKDWTDVSICPASFDKTVANSVTHLEKTCDKRLKKLLIEIELKRVCHVQ